jgi:hypothetical protein
MRFRCHLIGTDPDFPIHVSDRLLESHHGLFFQLGLKGIVKQVIQLPPRNEDQPDRYRLALRFEQFKRSWPNVAEIYMTAMDDRVQRSGMDQLILEPHGLYVFVDDTGHERLAGQDFYGLGGCAFRGADYDRLIRGPWSLVRFVVHGNMDAPLHATDFGRTATPRQIEEVVRFFREKPFMRIAAAGATTTALPEDIPLMRVVIESLKQRIVEVAKYQPFMSISVIFEGNQRADRDLQAYFGDVGSESMGTRYQQTVI